MRCLPGARRFAFFAARRARRPTIRALRNGPPTCSTTVPCARVPSGRTSRTSFTPVVSRSGERSPNSDTGMSFRRRTFSPRSWLAGDHPAASGRTYFVAAGDVVTWNHIYRGVAKLAGTVPLEIQLPRAAMWVAGRAGNLLSLVSGRHFLLNANKIALSRPRWWLCDATRAKRELGWSATTTLADGLEETYRWYLDAGWLRARRPRRSVAASWAGLRRHAVCLPDGGRHLRAGVSPESTSTGRSRREHRGGLRRSRRDCVGRVAPPSRCVHRRIADVGERALARRRVVRRSDSAVIAARKFRRCTRVPAIHVALHRRSARRHAAALRGASQSRRHHAADENARGRRGCPLGAALS